MSTAPVANVQQAGGVADGGGAPDLTPKVPAKNRQRFQRTLQHYVHNQNSSSNPTATATTSNHFITYKQGWAHVPYTWLAAAMTSADMDLVFGTCKQYRIIEQGFTIKRVSCLQQTATLQAAASTRINNSFVQQPVALLFEDDKNEIYEAAFGEQQPAPNLCIWRDPTMTCNGTTGTADVKEVPFAKVFAPFSLPSSKTAGTLRPVQIVAAGETLAPMVENFDLMNGGKITTLATGETFTYSWKPSFAHWFRQNYTQASTLTDVIPMVDTVSMVVNVATTVPLREVKVPTMFLIRVPPLQDAFGPIQLAMELWIEYFIEIEWDVGRFLFSRAIEITPYTPLSLDRTIKEIGWYPINVRNINREAGSNFYSEREKAATARHGITDGVRVPREQRPNTRREGWAWTPEGRFGPIPASKGPLLRTKRVLQGGHLHKASTNQK